ncbi:AI-2E family transporter [Pajaroellobacter abortibovis]|uniref:AI-2E family transporter n=1 Tax=Pajaroellobacter abortibovis TaxID=1882918 RepID=A0A1L6MXC8_9BACT|nr:AI-2E family transporter [Pajaroellobacter abortibovis]APS00109.1 hypothetical protein BCY86_05000 [Pajaroellobacter abortibovis]
MPLFSSSESSLRSPSCRWKRSLFLSISACLAIGILLSAHAVMGPFLMALVIAYVMTPLVAQLERKGISRVMGVLMVYAFFFGGVGLFIRVAASHIETDLHALEVDIPAIITQAKERWGLTLEQWVQEAQNRHFLEPSGSKSEEQPVLIARPNPDGSMDVFMGSGFHILATKKGYEIFAEGSRALNFTYLTHLALEQSISYLQQNAFELAQLGRLVVVNISGAILRFFITLMLAVYLVLTREHIFSFFASLLRPSSRPHFMRFLDQVDRGLGGVVRGQLLICLVNGVLTAIGFAFIKLKYWLFLAIMAMVGSLIPIFGAILCSIPAVVVGLTQSLTIGCFVLLWIFAIHQFEANFLNPKIMGDAAQIHPVLIVFSLLVGEHFFGVIGVLLAVPTMSILLSTFSYFHELIESEEASTR